MEKRIQKIRDMLIEKQLAALLITTPANTTYLTGFDFLSPTEREAYLLITTHAQYCISSFLYKEEFVQTAPNFVFLDISSSGGKPFWEHVREILSQEEYPTLGFEADNLTVAEYTVLQKQQLKMSPLSLREMRNEKDSEEIRAIALACTIGDTAFTKLLSHIHPGMTEKEVALQLDTYMRHEGAEPAFATIVAFGKNAAVPHHKTDNRVLQEKDLILLDFGAKIYNYCSDMSRTICMGQPTDEQKRAYETLATAQQRALDFLTAHSSPFSAAEVDKQAREYLMQNGFPDFPHSLGHSIGIEPHDGFRLSPLSPTQLTSGMVFSVEPGLYVPGNFGMRIEDIVALTEKGPKILTNSSREMIIL